MRKVLNHELPDRLPTWEYAIDQIICRKICPGGTYADVVEALDLDAAAAFEPSCGGYVPGLLDSMKKGDRFKDQWGVLREFSGEMFPYPLEEDVPIHDEADLRDYSLPDANAEDRYEVLEQYGKRFGRDRLIVYVIIGPWEVAKVLMGTQDFYAAFRLRPVLVRKLLDLTTDWMIEVARNAIDKGADMIMVGDDLGHKTGLFVSPGLLRDFYIPCLRRITEVVKKRRAHMFFHCHGNIWKALDMVIDTGIDALHPMAYEDQMDIGIVKKTFGSKIVVGGNIATAVLTTGSREDVVKLVRETIFGTSVGGGHMMMASSSLYSGVDPDNYRAMVETVHEYGKY